MDFRRLEEAGQPKGKKETDQASPFGSFHVALLRRYKLKA
jgi:hypothetical protein